MRMVGGGCADSDGLVSISAVAIRTTYSGWNASRKPGQKPPDAFSMIGDELLSGCQEGSDCWT